MDTIVTAHASIETIAGLDIPVFAGPQAQGDLIILPWPASTSPTRRAKAAAAAKPVTHPVVVQTGQGGHDHTLSPAPGVAWHSYPGSEPQTLGVLVVDGGAVAVLGHIEHGDTHIGPGVYVIRRQREQADEIRMVAD